MSWTKEQGITIRAALEGIGRWQPGTTIEAVGERLSGVVGASSVYQLRVKTPSPAGEDCLDLVVKFDEEKRRRKEVEALQWLTRGNKPHCVMFNLDGPKELEIMDRHGLIFYASALAHAPGHELISLETLLKRQLVASPAHCQSALTLTLKGLSLFQAPRTELSGDVWFKHFPKVEAKLPELQDTLPEPLRGALAQIKAVGFAPLGKIHGDLNLSNILVTMEGQAPTYVSLIDFADAKAAAPICIDLARLEAALWLDCIPAEYHAALALALSNGGDLKALKIPGLAQCQDLTQTLRAHVKERIEGHWEAYLMPLMLWYLRAIDFTSVKGLSKVLAQVLAEQAWREILSARSGGLQQLTSPSPDSKVSKPASESDDYAEVRALVLENIRTLLERADWQDLCASLAKELKLDEPPSANVLAGCFLDVSVEDLLVVFGRVLEREKASISVWESGLEIASWLVVLRVKDVTVADLQSLPVQNLLGAELVIARLNNRRAKLIQRKGGLMGEDALCSIEAGPNRVDIVAAIANQISHLLNIDGCKYERIEGALEYRRRTYKPVYIVVDEPDHPLAVGSCAIEVKKCFPSLVIVKLRQGVTEQLQAVTKEEYLTGYLSEYLSHLNKLKK